MPCIHQIHLETSWNSRGFTLAWVAAALTDRSDQWGFEHNRDISPTTQRGSIWPTTMSAIASFTKLPEICSRRSAQGGSWWHRLRLSEHKMDAAVAEYRWSGYVLATLLPYLEEKQQIDLMKSDELAAFLTNTTGTTHFIFTPSQWT